MTHRLGWSVVSVSAIALLLVVLSFGRPTGGPSLAGSPVASSSAGQFATATGSSARTDAYGAEGRGGLASCASTYTIERLRSHTDAMAFDGIVSAGGPRSVDYIVREWFRGPGGTSVRLASIGGLGDSPMTEVAPAVPGQRYLVVAEDGNLWGCGFTHEYSEGLAAEWRIALRP